MDYPTAIVIGGGIWTTGYTIVKLVMLGKHDGDGNGNRSRKELDEMLDKRLENIVYKDTCIQVQKRFANEIKLTRESLSDKIAGLSTSVTKGFEEIQRRLKP